ncbi:MAG: PEP-CTERM sorting domain-containing protein [Planctomycetales bacterium]|nr:PEP-CTERM sorting domain-containing protein [Planctomycetales bacterium]
MKGLLSNRLRRRVRGKALATAVAMIALATANAQAGVLEDFQFSDPSGTAIEAAANDAGTGHLWDVDVDLVDVKTNGSGQLNASLKSNLEFGTTYVDTDDFATGSLYGVVELSFAFDAGSLDAAENEEIRLSLIQFDPRSTFVTSEFEIQREDDNTVTIFGNAVGTGSVDPGSATIGLTQASMIAIIAANLDNDRTEVHYSLDGGASFATLSGGVLDPGRGVNSIRLTLNNDLSQDSVLIDRIYLTDMNPYPGLIPDISVPEPATALLAVLGMTGLACAARRRR